jgi:pimeloyl-ACP methyl ester carboxylesterase
MYSSGASNIFVLAFDYRGFGRSTGSPTEKGIMNDAVAVIDWALNVANVPSDRIVLLGHSLGTAIATAATDYYLRCETPISFAGLILGAGFTSFANASMAYSIANVLPLLRPVTMIPPLHRWFERRIKESWNTEERLRAVVEQSSRLRLMLAHARDDYTMQCAQTEQLFKSAIRAGMGESVTESEIVEGLVGLDLGEAGYQETWTSGDKVISKVMVKHGGKFSLPFKSSSSGANDSCLGHNNMMKWSPIALAVLQCLNPGRSPTK